MFMGRAAIGERSLRVGVSAIAVTLLLGSCTDSGDDVGTRSDDTTASATVTDSAGIVDVVDEETLRAALEDGAREFLLPGAVALLRTPSGTVTATYGTTERGNGTTVSLDDHIRVGSNTKTWTATVILQLAQEGKLQLSDPVSVYRPDVPNGGAITIEQLLNMRSGLYNYSESPELNDALDNDPQRVWTPQELLAIAFARPPYFPPGTDFHYSNTNYVLLGLIAEELDGAPLPQIFEDRVFDPAGLEHTEFPEPADTSLPDPYSHGYFFGTNMLTLTDPALPDDMQAAARDGTLEPTDVTESDPSWAWAAGAGISTANDLATWVEALADGTVLDADMQERRLDSIRSTDPATPDAAGYGWGIARMGPMYGHTGELPGYNSFMGSDPDNDVTLVVWANLAPGVDGRDPATTIARNLIETMYGN